MRWHTSGELDKSAKPPEAARHRPISKPYDECLKGRRKEVAPVKPLQHSHCSAVSHYSTAVVAARTEFKVSLHDAAKEDP